MHSARPRRRRPVRFALLAAALIIGAAPSLRPAQAAERPSYYPADYDRTVEASKKEGGLLIYSIMAEYNWRPVLDDFAKLYPWIQVSTLDLNTSEVFTRYHAERSSGAKTTDLIVSSTIDGWLEFVEKGEVLDYTSVEKSKLPAWANPRPGLYALSTDPQVIVYNKLLLPEDKRPRGIGHLAQLVKENPALFRNGLVTYNLPLSSYAQAINQIFLDHNGDAAWGWLDTIGPQSRLEMSAGPMLAKLASGEYKVAYFAGGVVVFPKLKDPTTAKVMGWTFIEDGTPLFMRMTAIPKGAPNPNSAKLMLDFILSHDGQAAFGRGGLVPYREDVKPEEVAYFTYGSIKDAIGEKNVLLIDLDPEKLKGRDALLERWKKAYQAK